MTKHNLQHQNKQLKQFIREFNFPNPTWENLPSNFPDTPTDGLTKAEKGMLTGITLAWYLEKGRNLIYQRCIKIGFTITFSIITLLYFRYITTTPVFTTVKEVSAATVSAGMKRLNIPTESEMDELIQSTHSAILKR